MKKLLFGALVACLLAGVVFARQQSPEPIPYLTTDQESVHDWSQFVPVKKCSFNSDCPYGKCKSGKCGGCSFNSDCNGWGVCKGGQCGKCSFSSECKGFDGCSSGSCKKSPY